MNQKFHKFAVGDFQCMVVSDGKAAFPASALTNTLNAPAEDIEAAMATIGLEGAELESNMNCLYIDTGDQRILVDTGLGMDTVPEFGDLLRNLQQAGVYPADIDLVFITHFHGDHIGGLINAKGERVFPGADYATNQIEWAYWFDEERLAAMDADRADNLKAKLLPLREDFTLVEDGAKIAPGIRAMLAPGHTPGHTGLMIESDGDKLFFIVDAIHQIVQMPNPEWSPVFDVNPAQSVPTRRHLLTRAADENLLTMLYHFPYPGLGHVEKAGDGFRWLPVQ